MASEITGFANRDGLYCRFPGCESCFRSDGSVSGIQDSAVMRNEHELERHGYVHRAVGLIEYAYNGLGRLSHRGRSTLSLHTKGKLT